MDVDSKLIQVKDLEFKFKEKTIFNGVSLDIPKGKIVAIMGPSGTGKTTLLRLIGAQLKPSSGSILYQGEDIHKMGRKRLFKLRQDIGLLFQSGALFTNLSVYEN